MAIRVLEIKKLQQQQQQQQRLLKLVRLYGTLPVTKRNH
jgi:hypothetical protein